MAKMLLEEPSNWLQRPPGNLRATTRPTGLLTRLPDRGGSDNDNEGDVEWPFYERRRLTVFPPGFGFASADEDIRLWRDFEQETIFRTYMEAERQTYQAFRYSSETNRETQTKNNDGSGVIGIWTRPTPLLLRLHFFPTIILCRCSHQPFVRRRLRFFCHRPLIDHG
ncbi:hypothetical protein Dda_5497 [Drechslerella dactyloides]|uniref:Uncharacterized protein n=1 Tax=Drechslerella dactyloides TaxID=74499 RepID=A0AAD6NIX3_DREDA|nr:hypothetical protein Dda_5497 [Drechslerella dactyloides]